jgi:hypothetical protein
MKFDTPTMTPYTVFPDWVFNGKLEINEEQRKSLINYASTLDKIETHSGWTTKFAHMKGQLLTASNLVGNMFFQNVVSHFALPEKLKDITVTDSQFTFVRPGANVPAHIVRMRWYTGVLFLDGAAGGSNLYLDPMNTKMYATPSPLIQEFTHFIDYQPMKLVFFPAHIPWGFTPNNSQMGSMFYTFSFHINPPDQKKR